MDQQKIEAIAQSILSLSSEERQLLEQKVDAADHAAELVESASVSKRYRNDETKLHRVAEIAQEIQSFEEKYATSLHQVPDDLSVAAKDENFAIKEGEEDTAYSFLRLAPSLQLEGPPDWSRNIDHYLYGLPKVEDD